MDIAQHNVYKIYNMVSKIKNKTQFMDQITGDLNKVAGLKVSQHWHTSKKTIPFLKHNKINSTRMSE